MLSNTRKQRRERGIWQRRYWEHFIKNEADFQAHVGYVHINPVKQGLVKRVKDWPYPSFIDWLNKVEAINLDIGENGN